MEPNSTYWRANHGTTTSKYSAKQPMAATTEIRGGRRPRIARMRSMKKTAATTPPSKNASFRASEANPTSRPEAAKARPSPRRLRAASQITAGTRG